VEFEFGSLYFCPQLQPARGQAESLLCHREVGLFFLRAGSVELGGQPPTRPQRLLQARKCGAAVGQAIGGLRVSFHAHRGCWQKLPFGAVGLVFGRVQLAQCGQNRRVAGQQVGQQGAVGL
jgi:hypothetical protein